MNTSRRTAALPGRIPALAPDPAPRLLGRAGSGAADRFPGRLPGSLPPLAAVCCLALALLLSGCAGLARKPGADPAAAKALWDRFAAAHGPRAGDQGFKISASLAYTTPGRGSRTLLSFWGNTAYPLRLDVSASLGASLSHFRDDGQLWVAYFPGERTAYTHTDAVLGQKALGLPFPFNLRDLALLISGDFGPFTAQGYRFARPGPDGVRFELAPGRTAALTLDAEARPLRLEGPADAPWTLSFSEYPEPGEGPVLARRLDMDLPGEEKAVLRVKSLEMKDAPWPLAGLKLSLPVDTEVVFLDEIGLMRLLGPGQDQTHNPDKDPKP